LNVLQIISYLKILELIRKLTGSLFAAVTKIIVYFDQILLNYRLHSFSKSIQRNVD